MGPGRLPSALEKYSIASAWRMPQILRRTVTIRCPPSSIGCSERGECALLTATISSGAVRSVVTWGSGGTLANIPEMADAMVSIIDSPPHPMKEFVEYLKLAYGEDNARAMTRSVGTTLRTIIQAGGDISRSRAANIAWPALLITGEHDASAPPPLVSEMAGAIPRAEFIEAKGASHPIHHEQPAWLTKRSSAGSRSGKAIATPTSRRTRSRSSRSGRGTSSRCP